MHGFVAAGNLRGLGDFAQPLGGRAGDRHNGGRRTLGFVDLLLLLGFRRLDDLLLLAFRLIDGGVALAFGRENHRAFLPLGAHLLFHRGQDIFRRRDVLDLIPQDLYAPGLRGLVQFIDDLAVDVGAFFERAVEFDFPDLAAERGLGQLRDGKAIVADAV